ncbi:MAG: DUF1294 domain-containing protein [Clostridia bacterium]|nr:DUF1294 domain-containing protein [Clostridia bacterium]MBQ3232449.1 DUF1294 domain-containing protein [Clostridia bacterium]MBQ4619574.1 DUF1294 domain-containing protein [Clostridia bacterium]MBQ9855446.1 DUF1294 domain-containing protein [Clostridia bacterium]
MVYAYVIVWAIMSIVTFCVYAADKMKAKAGKWRVKEKTLLLLALLMGAPGALIAMFTLRHKTLKAKFTIPVPVFLVLQAALFVFVIL